MITIGDNCETMISGITKGGLENGWVVKTRGAGYFMVLKNMDHENITQDLLVSTQNVGCWGKLSSYNNNLIHDKFRDFDIVSIYRTCYPLSLFNRDQAHCTTLHMFWTRNVCPTCGREIDICPTCGQER